GLPNRVYFLEILNKTMELAKRNGRHFAVLFLDLDGFKVVNDLYGHHVGDLLLKELSRRLTEGLRHSDVTSRNLDYRDYGVDIARLGGDEIIILLSELTQPEDAAIAAQHILNLIIEPVVLDNQKIFPGVSIGIAVFPEDGSDGETLLKNADAAMYHAKKMGKGNYQFFHDSMNVKARKRQDMENLMRQALNNSELRLHYQPLVNAASGKLVGLEALMRWDSPQLGFLSPDAFIPIAEENGMILKFGEWALHEVCARHKELQQMGLGHLTIAVNLSSLQLKQPGFVAMVKDILEASEADPAFMVFELTENILMHDAEKNLATLRDIKKLGIQLSIDDFGTGLSSLSHLMRFPLDSLKIDRSYVKELPNSSDDAAFVNAILTLANNLRIHSIAEGVETEKQKEFLQTNDCESIQGFLLSQPMCFDDLKDYLKRSH
ncbi:MAG: putative bifunctional diguanylate cyclase/phosphodiesterase, partial [Gammaproteobacteria bacterium]